MVTARGFVATAAGRLVLDLQQLNLEHQGSAARDLGRGATSAVAEAGWDDQLALGWHDQNKQTCKRKVTFNAKASAPSAQQTETYTLADAHAHKPLVPALQTHTRRHTSTHTRTAPTTSRGHPRTHATLITMPRPNVKSNGTSRSRLQTKSMEPTPRAL